MLLASVGVAFAAQSTGTTKKAKAQVNKSANARGAECISTICITKTYVYFGAGY